MERIGLQDRPGQFFVVSRALGRIQLLDEQDQEFSVPLNLVKVLAKAPAVKRSGPKPLTKIEIFRNSVESYWFVGRLLSGFFNSISVSTPSKRFNQVLDDLIGYGVKNLEAVSLSKKDLSEREVYTLHFEYFDGCRILENLGMDVHCHENHFHVGSTIFVRDFLIDHLGFEIGGFKQDLEAIKQRIEEKFLTSFEEGYQCAVTP
jgi:hypothetical protein